MQGKSKGSLRGNLLYLRVETMDKNTGNDIRRAINRAERGITKSIIRWKYRKEGRPMPLDDTIDGNARHVVNQAHEIIARRGRSVWNELKNVYSKEKGKKEDDKS